MRRVPLLDGLLALGGLVATAIAGLVWVDWGGWPYAVETLVCLGLSVALALRRRIVVGSAVATYLLLGVMAGVVWWSPVRVGVSPLLVCAPLSVVALTRYAASRWWGLGAAAAAVVASPLSPAVELASRGMSGVPRLTQAASMAGVNALVIVAAYLWAVRQREIADRHAAELTELRATTAAREELAAARERNRVAHEVHDVVAHSVALIQVEAATGSAIAEDDPEHARASLHTITAVSREALTEIRALVGVLREPGTAGTAPTVGLRGLPDLLSRIRGITVHADVPDGDALARLDDDLDPIARLAAVRVVQEATTNAVRHGTAGAPVHVAVRVEDDHLRIEVRNPVDPGAHADPGFGLLGLRERMDGAGGRIEHGVGAGEFVLTAELPWRQAAVSGSAP